jgi:opacity protein-like surface antigen
MRKLLISLAAAGSALALATPAAAQYYPQQQPYGYGGQTYGGYGYNGYGYNNRGQMQRELQQIRFQADNLARQGRLTRGEARDLYHDIGTTERALYRANNPWAARDLNQRITRLRYELHRYADYDGRRGYGWNGNNGYNSSYDRDRDGRDDRYEDDHGWQRDH